MAVPSLPLSGNRMTLRRTARAVRRDYVAGLSVGERRRLEDSLARHLMPRIAKARIVAGYAPLPDEISPLAALDLARTAGKKVAFPAFASPNQPFRFLVGEPTEQGPFGIDQPPKTAPAVRPDLILVPLLAIDRQGNRLGQGKGHYDKVLKPLKREGSLMIGIGWPFQMVDGTITSEAWDVPLDGFASPNGLETWS